MRSRLRVGGLGEGEGCARLSREGRSSGGRRVPGASLRLEQVENVLVRRRGGGRGSGESGLGGRDGGGGLEIVEVVCGKQGRSAGKAYTSMFRRTIETGSGSRGARHRSGKLGRGSGLLLVVVEIEEVDLGLRCGLGRFRRGLAHCRGTR